MLEIESVIGTDAGLFSSCQAQPMTESMVSRAEGNNMLGLEGHIANGPGFMFLVYLGVDKAEDEATAIPYVERFQRDVDAYADSLGGNWHWSYLNYAHGTQNPIVGYGVESMLQLQAASNKYDPSGVFQNLRQSGFKLPIS